MPWPQPSHCLRARPLRGIDGRTSVFKHGQIGSADVLAFHGRLTLKIIARSRETPSPSTYRSEPYPTNWYALPSLPTPEQFGPIELRRRPVALRPALIGRVVRQSNGGFQLSNQTGDGPVACECREAEQFQCKWFGLSAFGRVRFAGLLMRIPSNAALQYLWPRLNESNSDFSTSTFLERSTMPGGLEFARKMGSSNAAAAFAISPTLLHWANNRFEQLTVILRTARV